MAIGHKSNRYQREIETHIRKEIRYFGEILQSTWARTGAYFMPRALQGDDNPQRKKRGQRDLVRFAQVRFNEQEIAFRIKVRERGLFNYTSALPHRVRAQDLVSDEMLRELSIACERTVYRADIEHARGLWVVVSRLRGVESIPQKVSFSEVVQYLPGDQSKIVLGVGEQRRLYMLDLRAHPHMLVGGTTGGGKSNALNVIIAQLLRFDPDQCRLTLVDLKMGLEMRAYRRSPHVDSIVTSLGGVLKVLTRFYKEVKRRGELIARSGRRNVGDYNQANPDDALPHLYLVFDEFAEITLINNREFRDKALNLVNRLCNLGRAVGVHLILCTQRPAVETIGNRIKVNLTFILAGRVQSPAQSGVLLNKGRADQLPKIPGRMIAEDGQSSDEIQVAYISDDEIAQSVAISLGLSEKVIVIQYGQPVIHGDGLLSWLLARGGRVSGRGGELKELGVNRDNWRHFCEWLRKEKMIEKRWGITYLKFDQEIIAAPLALPPPPHSAPPRPPHTGTLVLPAPPVPLLLVAGERKFESVDHAIQMFVAERLERDPKATPISATRMYLLFCEFAPSVSYSKEWLGRKLKAMGIGQKRMKFGNEPQGNYWIGVRVRA